jgi:hypothetical protein
MSDQSGWTEDLDSDVPPAEDKAQKDAEARANRLEAQNRKTQKELEDLRAFKAQYEAEKRQNDVASVMKDAGLPPGLAAAWLAVNPGAEPTSESVIEYATWARPHPAAGNTCRSADHQPAPAAHAPAALWKHSSGRVVQPDCRRDHEHRSAEDVVRGVRQADEIESCRSQASLR